MNTDVVVIGGGHAGMEAAAAPARMGLSTVLIALRRDEIGQMSCNPAIGGLAKGQLAREIDALGGLMGRLTDEAGIQFRMLNTSKGPAVQSPRAQADRKLYKETAQRVLADYPNLTILEDEAVEVLAVGAGVAGVRCLNSGVIEARAVIITTGTFLRGLMHFGMETKIGGRMGSPASYPLSDSLNALGIELGRLKTGTPPRIDGKTVDFGAFEIQAGDEPAPRFSYWSGHAPQNRAVCHLGYTNARTHEIIRASLDRSPLYTGKIRARGPRYCPSIEDKVVKFAHHDRHYVFLEPEGLDTTELYVNGIATSLPVECQTAFVRTIRGLERAEITKAGYAVEYDHVQPYEIHPTLESKKISGLYFAGQINGTSGYEEAGALGLTAGINAGAAIQGLPTFVPARSDAYIGVLIDDITTKCSDEPYRMFTSLAEHRLILRQDNAHLRLWRFARDYGLLPENIWRRFESEEQDRDRVLSALRRSQVVVTADVKSALLQSIDLKTLQLIDSGVLQKVDGQLIDSEVLQSVDGQTSHFIDNKSQSGNTDPPLSPPLGERAGVRGSSALPHRVREELAAHTPLDSRVLQQVEIEMKYSGYIERQRKVIARSEKNERVLLPKDINYGGLSNLRLEAREKLTRFRPRSLAQAGRIAGVSPSDVETLMVYLYQSKR